MTDSKLLAVDMALIKSIVPTFALFLLGDVFGAWSVESTYVKSLMTIYAVVALAAISHLTWSVASDASSFSKSDY